MSNFVCLRSAPVDLDSDDGQRFVIDCTRAAEGLITDSELQEVYELSPGDWATIAKNTTLGRAIRVEREKRVLDGTAVRESSARHLVKGPAILAEILTGETTNPRHKIDAFQALRQTAIPDNTERHADAGRFIIRIDLSAGGGDVVTYNKSIEVNPLDGDGPGKALATDTHEHASGAQRAPGKLANEALMKRQED